MLFMKLFLSALLLSFSLVSLTSHASMSLDRVVIHFDPGKQPREDIVISNPDKEPLYLQTEVYRVDNPGKENEQRIQVTDPDQMKLLVTPQKAIIPPGARKTIRLVSLEAPTAKESVYRVTFKPVVGELEATKTAIKVLIAYQALVFVRPEAPAFQVTAEMKDDTLLFTNNGNINAVLRNGYYCPDKNLKTTECTELNGGTRLYAGQKWSLTLPESAHTGMGEIRYGLFDGSNEKPQTFPLPL